MKIHKLYYGPADGTGLTVLTSEGIRTLVNDDVIRERYNLEPKRQPYLDSKLVSTVNGPVLCLSEVKPCQAKDKRTTFQNHTVFVALADVIKYISPVLEFTVEEPLHPAETKEYICNGSLTKP